MGMTEFLLVVAVGGGIIAVLFTTFKGAASDADAGPDDVLDEVSEAQAEFDERHRAVLRSLEEIESDYETGNLSERDYRSLAARYEKEAASLSQQLDSAPEVRVAAAATGAAASSGSWMTGAIGWAAGGVAFVALAWLVMSQALSPRGPDGSITGSLPGQEMGSGSSAGTAIAEVDMGRLAALQRMVADDSANVEALVEVGHLYLTLQDYPNVTTVSMKALDLDPANPEALTHLGMVLMSVDHTADALAAFDRALEVDPTFGEALQFKGMVAFMSRDYTAAVQAWERYVEVVPEEEQAPRVKAMLGMARANLEGSQ
jgi:tetratricopeptide (TPR) repeat protein